MPENVSQLDVVWICACAGLVLFMQAGFLCLESGQTRNKNSINVAIKNLTDLCLSVFLFWLVGYGLMFGDSIGGIFGGSGFRLDVGSDAGLKDNVFFLFKTMFCGTAVTILSGGVVELALASGAKVIRPLSKREEGVEVGGPSRWCIQTRACCGWRVAVP